ncbi:MAG: glycerol-3-phosphate dehydrogenase/oxidase [Bacteroidota bacterium]|nr:glycerol-3-phosphate dehydrogenase/oxidase [Bacteroidota bacterium]
MKRFIENHNSKEYDLIIAGGGITGASVVYEAASRGLSVALLEKSDFASQTSGATSKMIHGGLRYLSTYEFGLVRESLRERRILSNIAPNLIHPASFLFAGYKEDKIGQNMMKLGMYLYELFAFDKNRSWDKSKHLPFFKSLKPKGIKELFPDAKSEGLTGGQMYYDCASHSPERLTLAFLKSAAQYGADISNYAEVTGFISEQKKKYKKITGVEVTDKLNNKRHSIKGKLVINCSGPWADILLDKINNTDKNHSLRRSEGIHFLIKKKISKHVFSRATPEGKHFFLVPYRNHTLVGTTDKEYIGKPEDYKVTKKAILELLEDVNSSYGETEKIKYEDIIHAYGGLRPLVEDQTEESYKSSRKYEITGEKKNGIIGLITVEGGKFTTSRMLAEKAVNKVFRILNLKKKQSISCKQYLHHCDIKNYNNYVKNKQDELPNFTPKQTEYMIKSYGNEIDDIVALTKEDEKLETRLNKDGEILAQVTFAVREEMAVKLSDIVMRRTTVGQLGNPGQKTLKLMADIAAKELNWSKERTKKELEDINRILEIPK